MADERALSALTVKGKLITVKLNKMQGKINIVFIKTPFVVPLCSQCPWHSATALPLGLCTPLIDDLGFSKVQ
jgi:hypothetical protein